MMVTFDVVAFVLRPSSCEWCAVILNSPIKPFTSQIQFVGHIQLQERKGKLITWEDGYSSVTTQAFQQLATEVSSKVVFWITLHFLLPAFQLIFFADSLTSIFFMTDLPLNVGVAMFSGVVSSPFIPTLKFCKASATTCFLHQRSTSPRPFAFCVVAARCAADDVCIAVPRSSVSRNA